MSHLFTPYALGPLQLKNRIAIAPMCQYSADNGNATDWHMIHLGHLALSGAGVLLTEATAVSPLARISADDLGLWSDDNQAALGKVVAAIRAHSAMPLMVQLGHAGRKASSRAPWHGGSCVLLEDGGWQTVAPSALPHAPGETVPLAASRIIDVFAAVTYRHGLILTASRCFCDTRDQAFKKMSTLPGARLDQPRNAARNGFISARDLRCVARRLKKRASPTSKWR